VNNRLTFQRIGLLLGITVAAVAVHGYHPYVEDAEIYLPGIKKLLNPALYPQNAGFFSSHAGMTLFPNLIAASIRISHLPFDVALFAWQFLCVFLLLLACWKIGRLVFGDAVASWGGVGLVASMLTIPVAGTALYIMDQYLNTRSLSTATVLRTALCARRILGAVHSRDSSANVRVRLFLRSDTVHGAASAGQDTAAEDGGCGTASVGTFSADVAYLS